MGVDKPDPGNADGNDAAAAKRAKIDETFAAIISDGLDDGDRQALEALALDADRSTETPAPTTERREVQKNFLALSETVKLQWIIKYKLTMLNDSYIEASKARASGQELQIIGAEIDSVKAGIALLERLVTSNDSGQTISEIVDLIEKQNHELEADGTPASMRLRVKYMDLLSDILPYYSNPTNLEKYYESSDKFQKFLKKEL